MEYKEFATEDMRLVMSRIAEVLNLSDSDDEVKHHSYTSRERITPKKVQPVLTTSSVEFKNLFKDDTTITTPRKVSKKEFEEKFITRSTKFLQRRETNIKQKQVEKEKKKIEGMTFKPTIDPKSRTMIGSSASIINRTSDIIKEKAQKIKSAKEKNEMQKTEEEKKELTLRPQVNSKKKRYQTPELFLKHVDEWHENSKKEKKLKLEKREKELTESLTFKPQLCRRSMSLVGDRKNIYERTLETIERQKSKKPPQYSFSPQIDKNSSRLTQDASKSVFERLSPSVRTFSPVSTSRNRDNHERVSLGTPTRRSTLDVTTPEMRASLGTPTRRSTLDVTTPSLRASNTPRPRNSESKVSPNKPPTLPKSKPKPNSRAAAPKLSTPVTPAKSVQESADIDILAELGLLSPETVQL